MRKYIVLALAVVFWGWAHGDGLGLQASSVRSIDGREPAFFCPACWIYPEDAGGLDSRGACTACGRIPVRIETVKERWYRCGSDGKWRFDPCFYNEARHCCKPFDSRAVLLEPGEGTPAYADYCPACRRFCWDGRSAEGTGRCSSCGNPAVAAAMTFRRWYWCGREGIWRTRPCVVPPDGRCGRVHVGPLLVRVASPL